MLDVRGLTYGFALGVGSMFLLDPERGAARRARFRDQSKRIINDVKHLLEVGTRDLENRARGLGSEVGSALSAAEGGLPEEVVVARVRSRLGRVTSHASAIEVRLKEGNEIELKGPALAAEHDRIVRAASRVRGVDRIDDDLVVYEEADGIPGLQGEGLEQSEGAGMMRAPGAKLLIGASVAAILISPLAPTFLKTIFYATMRSLMREASPQVMRRVVEKVSERVGVSADGDGRGGRQRDMNAEWTATANPT
jgi:hypothetical protein